MDFNAKRLALLAGVGNPEDRHVIVQEQAQQLNESIEARQASSDEEEVRKAVRRTIQKMIAEGVLDEGEGYGITGGAMHIFEEGEEEDEEEEVSPEDQEARAKAKDAVEKSKISKALKDATKDPKFINEADASLMRLQKLAGIQILSEGYTDDELRELCHSKDHNCAVVVEHPDWGRGKPIYESHALPDDEGNVEWYDVQFKHGIERKVMAEDMTILQMEGHGKTSDMSEEDVEEAHCGTMEEDEDHMEEAEEGMIYELEDGTLEMRIGEKRYVMQELEEDLDEDVDEGTVMAGDLPEDMPIDIKQDTGN